MNAENNLKNLKLRERQARRKLILDAARDLFAERDFRSVTVREIAGRAGVSVGTLYNYYENMTGLFLDIFLQNAQEIAELLEAENQSSGMSLHRLCECYIDYLNDHMTFYQMMGHFMLGGEMSARGADKLNTIMRRLMDHIEQALARTSPAPDSRLRAHALFSALNGIMISYARYPGRTDQEIRKHTLALAKTVARSFGDQV